MEEQMITTSCIVCRDEFETESEYYCLCPKCFEYLHRCMGKTKDGKQCKHYHSNVSGYCWHHERGHEGELTHMMTYGLLIQHRANLQQAIALPADNWLQALVEV